MGTSGRRLAPQGSALHVTFLSLLWLLHRFEMSRFSVTWFLTRCSDVLQAPKQQNQMTTDPNLCNQWPEYQFPPWSELSRVEFWLTRRLVGLAVYARANGKGWDMESWGEQCWLLLLAYTVCFQGSGLTLCVVLSVEGAWFPHSGTAWVKQRETCRVPQLSSRVCSAVDSWWPWRSKLERAGWGPDLDLGSNLSSF